MIWQTLPGIPDGCQHEKQECDLQDKVHIDPRTVIKHSTVVQHGGSEFRAVIRHPTVIQNVRNNNNNAKNKTSAWAEKQKQSSKWV